MGPPRLRPFAAAIVGLALSIGALSIGALAAPAAAAAQGFGGNYLAATEPRYSAIVMDALSGEVLYTARPDVQRYPASLTKVMTLYLTFDALASGRLRLDDPVTFSRHAEAQAPSRLGVRAGDSITVAQAISGMTVLSANDAAMAIGEKIAGSQARFAALMTLKARQLGMAHTNFATPNGLPDPRNVSTARDLAILARAVMRDFPQYYRFFGQKELTFGDRHVFNHNRLLMTVPGVDGMKTGYIGASGFNIVISGVKDGRRLIVVVLGGPSQRARDLNARDLLLTGFDVLARRARGERVDLASALYAPAPGDDIARIPTAQGDADPTDGWSTRAKARRTHAGTHPVKPRHRRLRRH